ncbi:MAG: agmatinase [Lysobacterales bacterium]
MRRFAGIEEKYCSYDNAEVLLQSIPYDGTSTWVKGADKGFAAFLEALENMELYDIETDSEAYTHGVHILPDIVENETPESMFQAVYEKSRELLASGKYLTCFGGEHSVSIGVIKAYYEKYKHLTVLQLDAHADLRDSYDGTPYNHACALHDASQNTNLIQVGIRSADSSEMKYLNRQQCYFAEDIYGDESWMDKSIAQMTDQVYLTIDLDAFDPSIMPATGTPEPGGLLWNTTIKYLRKVFEAKTVVGFDITEFAPLEGQHAPQFLVAKLYYNLLSYKFKYNG